MKSPPEHILLGRVIGVHGVRGSVKLHSECRPREDIFQYQSILLRNEQSGHTFPVIMTAGRQQGKGLVAEFAGYDNRDKAYALNGHTIWVHRDQLPDLAEDEFYWHDLIGLNVTNLAQTYLGKIDGLVETGANDVMVVKDGEQTLLIPFIMEHYIIDIDLARRTMQVDWLKEWSDPKTP